MPGEENGEFWLNAWELAQSRNISSTRGKQKEAHFNVEPLLTSTTGLRMSHLVMLVKSQNDGSSRAERQKLDEIHLQTRYGITPSRMVSASANVFLGRFGSVPLFYLISRM